ncbi:GyrI-like domain-containing protein [Arthrobacter castelli]|uniref:GyrI-like domain-containing protein n=1 Tax=Arthrobacter castelli TaxID=271431 RepID=UPI000405FB7D|nr:GyrI-like domain-containing protein [Arthrobacter castelli]
MEKIDLAKLHRAYYSPPASPVLKNFGPVPYIAIDGRGAPGGPAHNAAIGAQYPVAYAAKFAAKAQGRDFVVAKQEGLWWFDAGEKRPAAQVPREQWNWTLLIRVPDYIDAAALSRATAAAASKKPELESIEQVYFKELDEGDCVQMMHHGPFEDEPQTVAAMNEFMANRGLEYNGDHHEIYLTDIRRTPAAKWRTVLRYPVRSRQ